MSDKRRHTVYQERRDLLDTGWDMSVKKNHVAYNDGNETTAHMVLKTIAGKVLLDAGYRVASEVSHDDRGVIDLVGYGHPERRIIAVEIEHSPDKETISDKLDRYVHRTPIAEMFVIDPDAHSVMCMDTYENIQQELGL